MTSASLETLLQFGPVGQAILLGRGDLQPPTCWGRCFLWLPSESPAPAVWHRVRKPSHRSAHRRSQLITSKWKGFCCKVYDHEGHCSSLQSQEPLDSCMEQRPPKQGPSLEVWATMLCAATSSVIFIFKGTWEGAIFQTPSKTREKLAILLLTRATGKSEFCKATVRPAFHL